MNDPPAHRFLFYTENLDPHSTEIELSGEEHHHISRVLRMTDGSAAYVTNGRGVIVQCRIVEIGRRSTRLTVEGIEAEQPSHRIVTLALGCLRKDAFEQAVKQCVELGITRCLPFLSQKSHFADYAPGFVERLRRVALSAMKQSFRSTLPEVEPAIPFGGLVDRAREVDLVIVGDSAAEPLRPARGKGPLMMVVGPEGGFVTDERAGLEALGAVFASVSPYRLRSETAAAAMTAVVLGGVGSGADGASDSIDSADDYPLD